MKMWNYLWGYTAAQIELMAADAPIVIYPDGKKTADKEDIAAATDRWNAKYKDKESKRVDLSELLKDKQWQS